MNNGKFKLPIMVKVDCLHLNCNTNSYFPLFNFHLRLLSEPDLNNLSVNNTNIQNRYEKEQGYTHRYHRQ